MSSGRDAPELTTQTEDEGGRRALIVSGGVPWLGLGAVACQRAPAAPAFTPRLDRHQACRQSVLESGVRTRTMMHRVRRSTHRHNARAEKPLVEHDVSDEAWDPE